MVTGKTIAERLPGEPARRAPSRAQPSFQPGDLLAEGRFRIVAFIAQGGMGEVYEAEDLELRDRVALKTIKPKFAEDPQVVARFNQEIRLARQITHPNICRTYDAFHHRREDPEIEGRWQQLLFLTMELLPGVTLSKQLKKQGRLSPELALPIVEQMAAGLAAAHARGIVHRDFKSSNVILVGPPQQLVAGSAPRVVITDFGVAFDGNAPDGAERLTVAGSRPGTPAYMAPEQLLGRPVSPATDVFALGVVIFEMLTGERPFSSSQEQVAITTRMVQPPPSPKSVRPELDARWDRAVRRALEPDSAYRFASTLELVEALRRPARWSWLKSSLTKLKGVTARLAGLTRLELAGGLLLVVAAIGLLLVWLLPHGNAPRGVTVAGTASPAVAPSAPTSAAKAPPAAARPTAEPRAPAAPSGSAATPLFSSALARMRVHDFVSARGILQTASEQEPDNVQVLSALAKAAGALSEEGIARTAAARAFEKARTPADRLLAQIYYYQTRRQNERSLESARALFAMFPDSLEYGLEVLGLEHAIGQRDRGYLTLATLRRLPDAAARIDPRVDTYECWLGSAQGRYQQAITAVQRAIRTATERGHAILLGDAHLCEGLSQQGGLDRPKAERAYEQSGKAYLQGGHAVGYLRAQLLLAGTVQARGDVTRAQELSVLALTAARSIGNRPLLVTALQSMAGLLVAQRKFDQAKPLTEEATRLNAALEQEAASARSARVADLPDLAGWWSVTQRTCPVETVYPVVLLQDGAQLVRRIPNGALEQRGSVRADGQLTLNSAEESCRGRAVGKRPRDTIELSCQRIATGKRCDTTLTRLKL